MGIVMDGLDQSVNVMNRDHRLKELLPGHPDMMRLAFTRCTADVKLLILVRQRSICGVSRCGMAAVVRQWLNRVVVWAMDCAALCGVPQFLTKGVRDRSENQLLARKNSAF